jgi:plastocyanin
MNKLPPWRALRARLFALGSLAFLGAAAAQAATLGLQITDAQGKPLAGAVVFAQSREARAALRPVDGLEIVQSQRQFQPAVSVVPVGSAVNFPNRDTVRHHVYSFSPAKRFELKLYVGTPAKPVVFDEPGIAVLGCNIHDTMLAWVVIVDTPYHGRSDAQGRLSLSLPPGPYQLRTWHPRLPVGATPLDQPLTVGSPSTTVTVALPGLQP